MWKNFMTAIGLLAIALLAALYSSSAGRDGELPAAISGFLALGIAILVDPIGSTSGLERRLGMAAILFPVSRDT